MPTEKDPRQIAEPNEEPDYYTVHIQRKGVVVERVLKI